MAPRIAPAVQKIVAAGLTPVLTAPTVDGDVISAGGSLFVMVTNASGAPITVTAQTPQTVEGLAVSEQIVSVPAAGTKLIGPFPAGTYGRPSGGADPGKVYLDYSAIASVTRALISF